MKTSVPISANTQYRIKPTEHGYIVRFEQGEYNRKNKVGITIPYGLIVVVCLIVLLVFWGNGQLSLLEPKPTGDTLNSVENGGVLESQGTGSVWLKTGYLFSDSDERYLTADDIMMLSQIDGYSQKELLRFAVNEIYARHHYLFSDEEYLVFFNRYAWYDGYLDAESSVSSFNEVEHKNIAILLEAEEGCK